MPEMSTSLRQLVEKKYDAGARAVTLDGQSFGDQITSLLAILNIETMPLAAATLTPPAGTSPAPDNWSLAGTATIWGTEQCPFQIDVTPGQQDVAVVRATGSVPSITLPSLVKFVLPLDPTGAAGLDSITFANGTITALEPDGTLVYRAGVADGWSPFGLKQAHLERIQFALAVTVDPDWGRAQKAILTADLVLGSTTLPVEIDVPIGAGDWRLGIVPPGATIGLLSDIAQLLGGSDYQTALPKQLVDMTALQLQSLVLQFDPKGPSWSGIDLVLGTANPWPIAGNIKVENVGLALRVRPTSSPLVSGMVTGSLKVDPLEFQVAIPIPLSGAIRLSGRTNQPLPGFGALAGLVDAPFAASLPDGIAKLGSLQINTMFLAYDLDDSAISSLGIEVASAGPWMLIPSYLSLDNLLFGISAEKLSGGWSIQGIASGTILVAGIRVSIAVQGGSGAWDIKLTEPLLLPGIGELVSLVGGHDSSTALPGGFDAGIGAVTVYRYEMAFGGAGNSLQSLSLAFGTSNPWKFWDPYFILDMLNVTLGVTGPTGTRVLDASIDGVLVIAGIDIVLSAKKPATSTGWTFFGGLGPNQELAVGEFVGYLLSKFKLSAPDAVESFALTALAVTFVTDTKAFTFHAAGQFELAGEDAALTIDFTVNPKDQEGFTLDAKGDFYIGPAHFIIIFDKTPGKSVLTATWDEANAPIGFAEIADAFGFTPPEMPGDLDLTLTGAGFSYDLASGRLALDARSKNYGQLVFVSEVLNGERIYLFDFEIPLNIKLSDIPLAGQQIPSSLDAGIQSVELTYASAALVDVGPINDVLAGIGAAPLGPSALPQGINLFAVLLLGTTQKPLSLPLSKAPAQQTASPSLAAGAPTAAAPIAAAPAAAAPAAGAPAAYSGSGKWIDVGKSFGPFRIDRIGVQYQNSTLMFALDAGITFGPLAFSMEGLAIGSPLTHFSPVFSISGLGISYNQPPLQITGAVLRIPDAQLPSDVRFQFDGMLVLEAENLSLSAIGSYAQMVSGASSLFVFAQLEAPLGGPPAFFVIGLMAGFGFNRSLQIPGQDEVMSFPLLLLAQPPSPGVPAQKQDPTAVLDILEGRTALNGITKAWIAPQAGEYWLAAGLEFMSFELVRTKALLVVEFGREFEIALLGLSTMQLPQPVESAATYAYVQMQMRAVLKPDDGFFAATAILASSSYVLTPACHLTGGFAFYLWFGPNEHAGEFVITLGGYHPAFKPPSYFPTVPRLGFNWAVSDVVSITGNAYFALTTSCLMAGGGLDVQFHDGDLRAWYTMQADLLVSWRPFFFVASIDVSIGVSYRLDLLVCSKTITVSLGANVDLWGPPTGGTVHIHLIVVTFSVSFGSDSAGTNEKPLPWNDFKSLLPHPDTVCRVNVNAGLYKTQDSTGSSSGKTWIVRATGFGFATQSAIPASHLEYGAAPKVAAKASLEARPAPHAFAAAAPSIAIRPMNQMAVTSVHRLAIYKDGDGGAPIDVSKWKLSPAQGNVAESLWGAPPTPFTQVPDKPSANLIPGQMVGYAVQAPPPMLGESPGLIPVSVLREEYIAPAGLAPLVTAPTASADYVPSFNAQTVGLVQDIMQDAVAGKRDALYAALSAAHVYTGPNGSLAETAARAGHLFSDAPMQQT